MNLDGWVDLNGGDSNKQGSTSNSKFKLQIASVQNSKFNLQASNFKFHIPAPKLQNPSFKFHIQISKLSLSNFTHVRHGWANQHVQGHTGPHVPFGPAGDRVNGME